MKIFLLRHGQAEARAATDELRKLTAEGRQAIRDLAGQFKLKHETLDCCFCSPYLRAQETAQLFLSESEQACELRKEDLLTPEKPAQEILAFLQTLAQSNILLVGHNPSLTSLFALLTHGATDHRMKIMAAGELCCIEFELLAEGLGASQYCLLSEELIA